MLYRATRDGTGHAAVVSQRFEAKYRVSALQAMAIREHIAPFVDPDAHGREYPVTSIYLDSPDLAMYWSSARGEERRYKLRVRTYENEGGGLCFFEVKGRRNQVILKKRAVVRQEFAESLLAGAPVLPEMLVEPARDIGNLYAFQELLCRYHASPKLVVRYMREAYVGKMDEPLRITFDSQLTCLPSERFDPAAWFHSHHWFEAPGSPIVLEVKFTDTFPIWMEDIVRRLNLIRDSFSKYVVCVDFLRAEGLTLSRHTGVRA